MSNLSKSDADLQLQLEQLRNIKTQVHNLEQMKYNVQFGIQQSKIQNLYSQLDKVKKDIEIKNNNANAKCNQQCQYINSQKETNTVDDILERIFKYIAQPVSASAASVSSSSPIQQSLQEVSASAPPFYPDESFTEYQKPSVIPPPPLNPQSFQQASAPPLNQDE